MAHLSAEAKHHILLHYRSNVKGFGFHALASLHGVAGGGSVVRDWHQRWDGTAASLQRKVGTGNKPILTPAQVNRTIVAPVRLANRAHRAIHYRAVAEGVRRSTRKSIALRTVQEIGHNQVIKQKTTLKRTHKESEFSSQQAVVSLQQR